MYEFNIYENIRFFIIKNTNVKLKFIYFIYSFFRSRVVYSISKNLRNWCNLKKSFKGKFDNML